MEIEEHKHGAVTVVRPVGPLVQQDAELFAQRMNQTIQANLGRAVVDASSIPYVDSRGLEVIADIGGAMSRSGRSLAIIGANETLREVFDLTDVSTHVEHYEDVGAAVRSFL